MLQVLPPRIANLIAAGEVVQRPASVVKELMENAIDAGATRVSVEISDAGKTLIRVTDDGCGMSAADARLAFERHATSKIAEAEDLNAITTYGFRGEALPSIAAVSDLTLRTRRVDDELGSETRFSGSEFVSQEPIEAPVGTCLSVRNLFYNVPARRKFLKSDASEFRAITQEFCRVALAYPELSFKLIHNGKDIYQLSHCNNRKLRIREIAGKEISQNIMEVSVDTPLLRVQGFVGTPEESRKSQPHQYLFLNGRYFQSRYLFKAIAKAYEKIIPSDHVPVYFLYLECDPASVDINIHPAKIEVKFENEAQIFELIHAAVRETVGKNAFGPSIDFDTEGAPEIPVFDYRRPVGPPKIDYDPLFNPFEEESTGRLRRGESTAALQPNREFEMPSSQSLYSSRLNETQVLEPQSLEGPAVQGYAPLFRDEYVEQRPLLQVHGKYLITTMKSGILLIDVQRAQERIFYERYRDALAQRKAMTQETLFPQPVTVDPLTLSLLADQAERLLQMGFDIRPFGDDTVVIYAYPEGFPVSIQDGKRLVDEVVCLLEQPEETWLEPVAALCASCRTQSLNPAEAQFLVDALFACAEPNFSPRGKRCMTLVTMDELAKLL
ncbi:MAG: DNA mismatch repair endonuclease MutL [Bacteroidales bacterium]|nr:DNA mismatch repair endonuclease MutL [Bacteroidales bacterium]